MTLSLDRSSSDAQKRDSKEISERLYSVRIFNLLPMLRRPRMRDDALIKKEVQFNVR
jgi:hypothetical protein